MKQVLFLCLTISLVLSKEISSEFLDKWDEVVGPYQEECAKKFNADLTVGRNMFRNGHIPDEPSIHCYMRCVYTDAKLLTPDGVFDQPVFVDKVHFVSKELADRCLTNTIEEKDLCKRAYMGGVCLLRVLKGD